MSGDNTSDNDNGACNVLVGPNNMHSILLQPDAAQLPNSLLLGFDLRGSTLHEWWQYDTKAFTVDMVARFDRYFTACAEHALRDPARPISDIMADARIETPATRG